MILKAVKLKDFDFSLYGKYYDMINDKNEVSHTKTIAYEDHMTKKPLIDTLGHLGMTISEKAPYLVTAMEKHDHTQEALFCAGEPIILCLAIAHDDKPPQANDIRAVILEPGDVFIINRNIWHDACRGLGKNTAYYYLATAGKHPAKWLQIEGEPVTIEF